MSPRRRAAQDGEMQGLQWNAQAGGKRVWTSRYTCQPLSHKIPTTMRLRCTSPCSCIFTGPYDVGMATVCREASIRNDVTDD